VSVRRRIVAGAVLLAVAAGGVATSACSSAPLVEARAVSAAELPALQDTTRELVRPHCGLCHAPSSPEAKSEALAVFDLERQDWGDAMNRGQLATFRRSIARRMAPGGAEQAAIDAYVGDLLARAAE
jgi:hypothetical protein